MSFYPPESRSGYAPPESIVANAEPPPSVEEVSPLLPHPEVEKPATRQINASGGQGEGQGWVLESSYPDVGEPDWRREAEWMCKQWAYAEENAYLFMQRTNELEAERDSARAEVERLAAALQEACVHLHWLTTGGDFSHDIENELPLSHGSMKEWRAAREALPRLRAEASR